MAGYTPPQGGSFIPFMSSVLKVAKERGWEVEAVFPQRAEGRDWLASFEAAGIPVRFELASRRESTRWIEEMLEESAEPAILHTHFTVYDVAAALASRRRPDVHVYWHVHTVLSSSPKTVVANAIKFRILGRYVDRILCSAANIADGIRRRLGPAGKIEVFPSPIDVDAFEPISDDQRRQYREALGVSDGLQGLLLFGRDWEIKGGELFLEALGRLVGEGRPVVGLINQGGDVAQSRTRALGLESHVRIVGLDPNVQAMYGAAELLVAPSRGEGMPFTVVESLCSGTPVVASDLPGHSYLGAELDACAITQRDPDQIAAAVAEFLDMDPSERARRCDVARAWISERLGLQSAAQRLVDDYERTLGESS
jgi:Glycosyltransferase